MAEGGIVALMATCSPGTVAALAERVDRAGRRFLDAPVSGGTAGAQQGTLSIMAAGVKSTFEAARPVLAAMGDRVFHVGERPGQGATVKTVNQLLCGVHIAVVAEALSLAAKLGVDLDVILEIMSGSSASSWMLMNRGPRMLQAEPEVTSAVDIFVKDLGIVLEAGREAKAALPLAALAHQLFLATSGRGDGARDDSQVIRTYALMNGTKQP
jgi:3-hydroxyisobutyrate dehydrogenase